MKKPYTCLEIYNFEGEISINLTDGDGFEVSELKLRQLKNKKVKITIGHGFIL